MQLVHENPVRSNLEPGTHSAESIKSASYSMWSFLWSFLTSRKPQELQESGFWVNGSWCTRAIIAWSCSVSKALGFGTVSDEKSKSLLEREKERVSFVIIEFDFCFSNFKILFDRWVFPLVSMKCRVK